MEDLANLLKSARAGDPDATEALVRSQIDRMYGVAFRVTGDRQLAEDVVQEVFLRVFRGRSTCRNPEAASTWLTRITVRMALDQLRDRTARRRREEKYAEARLLGAGEAPGEGRMEANDLEILNEGLASLSADGRACVWLHFAEGLNVREVADHIGKGKSATANRIREAADHLRTFLTKRGFALGMVGPLPDLLRGLPRPVSPPGLSEKILKAARLPGPANRVSRDWITTFSTWGVVVTGKHIAAVAIALSILVIAGWGGMKFLDRPGAGGQVGPDGGPPPIARSEPSPAPAAPAGGQPTPAAAVAPEEAPVESKPPAEEKPTTLKGHVVDTDGDPVSKAHVTIFVSGASDFQPIEKEADDSGNFEFEGLPARSYDFSASDIRQDVAFAKLDFPSETEVTLSLPALSFVPIRLFLLNTSTPVRNGEIEVPDSNLDGTGGSYPPKSFKTDSEGHVSLGPYVRNGESSEHLVTIQHGTYRAETLKVALVRDWRSLPPLDVVLSQGISARGVLRNFQGAPIPKVEIRWRKPGSNLSTQLVCTTDESGKYQRDGLEPCGYIAFVGGIVSPFMPQPEVEIGEGPIQEVNLTVDCVPVLEIRLEDQAGNPLEGVKVHYSAGGRGFGTGGECEPTDKGGRTKLLCIQTGIRFNFELRNGGPGTIHADYTASPEKTSIVLRLDAQIKLSGTVMDGDQKPAPKAAVSAVPIESLGMQAERHQKSAEMASDGRFKLVLPPGNYRVVANGGKLGATSADVSIVEGTPLDELRLELGDAKAVRVHVLGPDGESMGRLPVRLGQEGRENRNNVQTAMTDQEGWVSFPVGAGTYSVEFRDLSRELYISNPIPKARAGGVPIEVQVSKLDRTVSGVVLHNGQPVPKANVCYWHASGGWYGELEHSFCSTDGEGKFELTQVNDRNIRVIAWAPGFAMACSELLHLPESGKVEGIIVSPVPGKDFQARFLDPDGKPLPDLRVKIYVKPENDPFMTMGTTDQEGILRIPKLPPGDYTLRSETPDRALALWTDFSWDGQGTLPEFQLKKNRPPQ